MNPRSIHENPEKPKHSRREFLFKRAPTFAAATLAMSLGFENPKQLVSETANTIIKKRLVDFQAEGKTFRGVFWMHGDSNLIEAAHLRNTDFLPLPYTVIETGYSQYLDEKKAARSADRLLNRQRLSTTAKTTPEIYETVARHTPFGGLFSTGCSR